MSTLNAIWRKRIVSSPDVCSGEARIQGTRITVDVILDNLAIGLSWDEILSDYPALEVEDIRAVLAYSSYINKKRYVKFGHIVDKQE